MSEEANPVFGQPGLDFDRLLEQYQVPVLRVCYLYLCDRSQAEDAVQETFLRVYRSLHTFRGGCNEKTWIMKIAMRVCYDINHSAWCRRDGSSGYPAQGCRRLPEGRFLWLPCAMEPSPGAPWFEDDVETIGAEVLADSNVRYVFIPYGCSSIGPNAFPRNTIILGFYGSYYDPSCAEEYANNNGYKFCGLENPFSGNG